MPIGLQCLDEDVASTSSFCGTILAATLRMKFLQLELKEHHVEWLARLHQAEGFETEPNIRDPILHYGIIQ